VNKRNCLVAVTAALLLSLSSNSQTSQTSGGPNPGVKPTRLMDRPDVRVLHVDVQPGAVRAVHAHNDVRFHLFIPVSGQLELTVGSAAPIVVAPGEAQYIEKGTPHGFRNIGNTPAVLMEVFVKDASPATASK
jgi:quercetin dioxygenase-like cupin family protein